MSNKSKYQKKLPNAFVLTEALMATALLVAGVLTVLLLCATVSRLKRDIDTRLDVISFCTNSIEFCKNDRDSFLNQSDRFKITKLYPKVPPSTTARLAAFLGLRPNDHLSEVDVIRLHASADKRGKGDVEIVATLF